MGKNLKKTKLIGRPAKGDPPKLDMTAEEIAKGIFQIATRPVLAETKEDGMCQ